MTTRIIQIIFLQLLISCGSSSMDKETIDTDNDELTIEKLNLNDSLNIDENYIAIENDISNNSILDSATVWNNVFKLHQIGYLTIGDSVETSLARLKMDFNIVYDSIEACVGCFDEFEYYYGVLDKSNEIILTVHPGSEVLNIGLIQHIKLYSKDYKSDRGIGIGSTAKDLKEKHEISEAYYDYENGLFFFVTDFKGSFRFDCCHQEKYHDINFENPSIETVPDDMIVDMIVIL